MLVTVLGPGAQKGQIWEFPCQAEATVNTVTKPGGFDCGEQ